MVVFTCGHCGESVQKPKVEKHYMTICRNRNPNLSCMDCFKDFLGQDYESHIKCITEEERYSGKGFVSKEKKGEKKQNAWVEMLQSVLDEQKSAPRNVLRIIETISKHNNTPRKKPKFINFVKNVCGQKTNPKDIDQAWDLISVKLTALSNANNRNQNQKKDVTEEEKPQTSTIEETDEKPEENDIENEEAEENGVDGNGVVEGNGEAVQNEEEGAGNKKKSKKQRKEEKKHKKYEAELQSAAAPPEEVEEETETKKGKKKKNRTESVNGEENVQPEGKNGKNKKRKRQDTVNSVNGAQEVADNGMEVEAAVATGKAQKKKSKTAQEEEEEAEESICLHDQNVAKIGELAVSDKFNWHAVIISVLQKKGNELPFKRLQKKVLGEYSEATGREVDDRIADKFIKKLKSAPNVRVDKNRVLLID
ncbi:cell growth-regulating nucleolar protein [Spodoptera frugiperda]|uniref:Cell growth-regulating nucleolar protein n=1 Tax=Spodoptera frugiperda TaxID=7108 RepID=A0A9R0DW76_SPOFR|nr:cell growth-regulating nucleolar protein [Spodoptera frugiperda]XP_050553971.1 cell growth-regulating nucleolar protein [Spodoptera frugiperda]